MEPVATSHSSIFLYIIIMHVKYTLNDVAIFKRFLEGIINHKSRENEEVVFEIVCDGLYTDCQTDTYTGIHTDIYPHRCDWLDFTGYLVIDRIKEVQP